ncbi:carbohydrate ABC transporter permease [Advenella sp. S44]|uniref:carbohydrate ABC transporter permease n=1 Tax=Advenella sp. S44 TaxID=1982755 RepID=UPI0013747EE0|nr:sugar ABC transporter permease [Advenella sp. S44]
MSDSISALKGDRFIAYCTLLPSAVILLLLVAIPTVLVAILSTQEVGLGEHSGPFVGLSNFIDVLTSDTFYRALVNTIIWVFGSVGLDMLIGTAIALLLSKTFFGRGIARAIVLAPYLIPTVVAVLIWKYMFHDIVGVLNYLLLKVGLIEKPLLWLTSANTAMLSVILVGAWKFFPFVVLALLGILQAIPQEQYEAAKIDGASAWQQFVKITLPHVLPVFLLTAMLRTIWTFHKFDIIYLLTGGGPLDSTTTLPVLVYQKAFVDFETGNAAAIAIVTGVILAFLLGIYFVLIKLAEDRQ